MGQHDRARGGGILDLDAYQAEVAAFVREHGGYFPPLSNLARLAEEVGELARLLNARFGPKRPKEGEALPELEEELGDILFVLAVLAAELDVSLSTAGTKSLEKARRRDATRFGP
jgi:NTP pyrophosphatase (non-canonical NTP hydrolase)